MNCRLLLLAPLLLSACRAPDTVNIQLRKDKQDLQEQVDHLKEQVATDRKQIEALESRGNTVPILPQNRLDRLVTVTGIRLGRLTGGADLEFNGAADEGLKIYLEPFDAAGEAIKATGTVTVEAFDLSGQPRRVGEWKFEPQQMLKEWRSFAMLKAFVLKCPFKNPPNASELTVKVTFVDELTGRTYHAQQVSPIHLATTRPAASGGQ